MWAPYVSTLCVSSLCVTTLCEHPMCEQFMCDHSMWALYVWPLYVSTLCVSTLCVTTLCEHSMWALSVWALYICDHSICVTTLLSTLCAHFMCDQSMWALYAWALYVSTLCALCVSTQCVSTLCVTTLCEHFRCGHSVWALCVCERSMWALCVCIAWFFSGLRDVLSCEVARWACMRCSLSSTRSEFPQAAYQRLAEKREDRFVAHAVMWFFIHDCPPFSCGFWCFKYAPRVIYMKYSHPMVSPHLLTWDCGCYHVNRDTWDSKTAIWMFRGVGC